MLAPDAILIASVIGLVLSRPLRTLAAATAAVMVLWLHLWWVLPLLGVSLRSNLAERVLVVPSAAWIMSLGHLVLIVLLIVASGVLSPSSGSPAAYATLAEKRGDYLAAGEFWQEAGRPRRAFRAFLRGRAWARAADIARSLGDLGPAVELYEREGGQSLATAAQLSTRLGDEEKTRSLWMRWGSLQVEARHPEQAVEPFLRAGDPRRAVHAVELALAAQRLTPSHIDGAMRAAREAKRPALAAQVALAGERFRDAGDLFLAANEPLQAARAFTRSGDALRAAEALRLAGREEAAARLRGQSLSSSGQFDKALLVYETAGLAAKAAATLVSLGRFDEAVQRYLDAGLKREAAELARDHAAPGDAAGLFEELQDWEEAGKAWERAGDHGAAARCFERCGDQARALELYAAAGQWRDQAQLFARLGRVEEGFGVLFASGDMEGCKVLLAEFGGTFPALAGPLAELAQWLESQGDLPTAISTVQRASAGLPASRELLPALYIQAQLLEKHGDRRAAQSTWQRIVEVDYAYRDAAARLQASSNVPAAGTLIPTPAGSPVGSDAASRYSIEAELGRGGMGVVYRATDNRLGRAVAIKVLNPRQHTSEALRRFEREARAAAALSHPGIVHIYDFDSGFGSSFISMEHVDGPTLAQLLRDEPLFVREHLLDLITQIGEAVAYAHSHKIVHRDLKPANMLYANRRQVKILDFGIARRLDDLDLSASGATGTPFYMAPEQILGEEPTTRTDVYSMGVTFFQMATGNLPFATGNVLRAHLEQPPPDPRTLAPDLAPALASLINRCLSKDPSQRFADASDLLASLSDDAQVEKQ